MLKAMALIEGTKAYAKANSHKLLGIAACGGAAITAALAFRAGMKCEKALKARRDELNLKDGEKLETKEVVKTCWKELLPPVIGLGATCTAAVASFKQADVKIEALSTAYKVADQGFRAYKEQVEKELGPKKLDTIKHETAKKIMKDNNVADVPESKIIYCTGDVLFYDPLSDRVFKSDPETVRRCVNEFNTDMINGEMYKSLNEWYEGIGLRTIDIGDELGWTCDRENQLDIDLVPEKVDDINGNEKLVWKIVYNVPPFYNYATLYNKASRG